MEQDRLQEVRGLFQILEQTAEIADDSLLTQAHKNGEKRCILQFNNVLSRLNKINAVSDNLFEPLQENATYSEISIACRHLAAYLSEGLGISADLKMMMTNILGKKFIENIGEELKEGKIGDLIRKSMPDYLSVTTLEDIKQTFNVHSLATEPGQVDSSKINLETDIGSVDIQTSESDVVTVIVQRSAQLKADRHATDILKDFLVSFNKQANELQINAKFKEQNYNWRKVIDRLDVHFHITVPQNRYDVIIKTGSGDINTINLNGSIQNRTSKGTLRYENITGPILGYSGKGDIRVTNCNSPVQVETIRGNIEINRNTGQINARTSEGNVRCADVDGAITTETTRGTIKLMRCKGGANAETSGGTINLQNDGPVIAKTVGGSIMANVLGKIKDNWSLETTGGDITVTLDPDVPANLNAKSLGGEIISELPINKTDQEKQWHLIGNINGEGPLLNLRSIGGDIYFKMNAFPLDKEG